MEQVTERAIRKWHADCGKYISAEWGGVGCPELLRDPRRIYNIDETGIFHDARSGRVHKFYAQRGSRQVQRRAMGTSKMTTITGMAGADGWLAKPVILTESKTGQLSSTMRVNDWREAGYDTTESGWQTSDSFLRALEFFIDQVKQREEVQFPIAVFVDGHRSHVNEEAALWSRRNKVILYGLNANSTFLKQPWDVGLFAPLKSHWYREVVQFYNQRVEEEETPEVTTKEIPKILRKVWGKIDQPKTVKDAFRKCGLFPWNVNAIDFSRLSEDKREDPLRCYEEEEEEAQEEEDAWEIPEGDEEETLEAEFLVEGESAPVQQVARPARGGERFIIQLEGDTSGGMNFRVPHSERKKKWLEGIQRMTNYTRIPIVVSSIFQNF